jgi:hypothetical protein
MAAETSRYVSQKIFKKGGKKCMEKREYVKPELAIHGDIEKITLNGTRDDADVPNGPANTANCAAGSNLPGCRVMS